MDKLRSIEVYVNVVEASSFRRAADRLGISPVMVGNHIRQLERHLGTRLIQRTTRSQSLTDAGRTYYREACQVLEQVNRSEQAVAQTRKSPTGLLRITAPVTLGNTAVSAAIASYMARYPDVRVELVVSDALTDLTEEGYDFAFRIGPLAETAYLVARPLRPYRMVVCAAPAYLERQGVPASPADLADHRCLNHLVWNRQSTWRVMDAPQTRWPEDAAFASNSGPALRLLALHGAGLLMQPEALVGEDIAAGRLVRVLDQHLPSPRPVHLLYAQDLHPSPKQSTFIAHVLEEMGAPSAAPD